MAAVSATAARPEKRMGGRLGGGRHAANRGGVLGAAVELEITVGPIVLKERRTNGPMIAAPI
jgi:hypothetical protein